MARKITALIGVDIGAKELRAVEVSADGKSVKRFASCAVGGVGLDRGVPSDPTPFADILRNLFKDLSPATRTAVFGVPATAITTRTLDIPQVPDNELRNILQGEVQHFGIIRGFGGMFDYVRLARETDDEDTPPQALVMACEGVQLNSIRDAAERAKIEKAGIEPSQLGLMRLAASRHAKPELGMLVALCGDLAEVAVIYKGGLKLYRRLDLGAEAVDDSFLRGVTGTDEVPAFLRSSGGTSSNENLALGLKRTLDYVAREYQALGSIDKVILAVSSPAEAKFAEELGNALGLTVELATAPLPGDDGVKFAAAYGLALQGGAGLPTFELSPYDPVEEAHQQQRRILATSLVASILIVLAGIAGGFWFGKKANGLNHDLEHAKDELANLQQVQMPEAEQRQSKLEQYRALSGFGLPVPQIIDSLASKLDPKTGIQEVEMDGSTLKISGEAADEASMIRTLEQLRLTQGFKNAFIESFDQNSDPARKFVKFRMTAQLGSKPEGGA